jgi:transcriptional regulator with XRE-family HTH domain
MPQPLWKIRERKGMSINELATKAGVPAISIQEYESGRAIRSADLPKLAKALFVEEWDIELQSAPRPKPSRPRERERRGAPRQSHTEPGQPKPAKKRAAPLARPTQIEHLLTLTQNHFDKDRAALEREAGKPLEQLTRREASELLHHYQKLLSRGSAKTDQDSRVKRKRAYLPESVDEFELKYLTEHQEAGTALRFTLFNGQQMTGSILGFSPYAITICGAGTGEEITLQKLAIAYYRALDTGGHRPAQEGEVQA